MAAAGTSPFTDFPRRTRFSFGLGKFCYAPSGCIYVDDTHRVVRCHDELTAHFNREIDANRCMVRCFENDAGQQIVSCMRKDAPESADRIASALREAYENKSARAVMEPGFTAAEIKEWVQTLAPAYEPGRSSAQTQAGESRSTAKPKASEARRPSRSKSKRKVPSTRVSRHPGRAA